MKDKTCLDARDALRDVESGAAIFVGGFGGSGIPARLLAALLAKPGVNARRMRIAAYWKRGDVGHHEELIDA